MKELDLKENFLPLNSSYWIFQKIGYVCLFLILLATFFGLTGNGIFGQKIISDSSKILNVQYDPIIRAHTNTTLTIFLNSKNIKNNSIIKMGLAQVSFKHLLIKNINPKPISESIEGANFNYIFHVSGNSETIPIQIWLDPQQPGINKIIISIDNLNSVAFKQIILP